MRPVLSYTESRAASGIRVERYTEQARRLPIGLDIAPQAFNVVRRKCVESEEDPESRDHTRLWLIAEFDIMCGGDAVR